MHTEHHHTCRPDAIRESMQFWFGLPCLTVAGRNTRRERRTAMAASYGTPTSGKGPTGPTPDELVDKGALAGV
eukprot:873374-Prymnesium_polylepis.1